MWCCVGAGFATLVDSAVIAYAAPAVTAGLAGSASDVQWFLASYSLTFGLGLVPAGRLGDAYGRRGLLLAGLALFLLGALLSAAAPGIALLVGGRLVQGLGAGFISAQVLGLIQDRYAGSGRVRALGAYTAAGAAAAVAGPILAGAALLALPPELAWRAILLLPAPFIAATMWVAWRRLPGDAAPAVTRVSLDLPGIALLGALVVVVTLPAVEPGLPASALPALAGAVVGLGLGLVWWERRYRASGRMPLFAPPLMRSTGFLAGNLVALLWFGSLLASTTAATIYLLQELGVPALALALILLPSALARMIAARFSSRVFTRLGPSAVTFAVGAEAAGLGVLALATTALGGWAFASVLAAVQTALGVCSGLGEPAIRAVTLGHAPRGMSGVAASFLQLTQRLAATFMVALATGLLLADGVSAPSLRDVLLLCGALTAASALASGLPAFRARSSAR
nr:MFS transporter [Leucobacter weissii]